MPLKEKHVTPTSQQMSLFDSMYRQYCDDVYRFAWYLTGHRENADDLYQEVWLRAARHADSISSVENQRKWLFTITANCHKDWLRKAKLRRLVFKTPHSGDADTYEPGYAEPADVPARMDTARAIALLPPRQKRIVVLKLVEGYKIREIADMLGVHTGTVKSMLHKAVAKMRFFMSQDDPEINVLEA